MTSTNVDDVSSRGPTMASVGKEPRSHARKPRRRKRMLTGVSRQRREANARERQRIQGVNAAFLSLKAVLPVIQPEEVSKMETLHLAAKWIAHLTTILIQDDQKRKWSPETSSGKCLPQEVQEKLNELLNFDLEDFVLIANFNSTACKRQELFLQYSGLPGSNRCLPGTERTLKSRLSSRASSESGNSDSGDSSLDSHDSSDSYTKHGSLEDGVAGVIGKGTQFEKPATWSCHVYSSHTKPHHGLVPFLPEHASPPGLHSHRVPITGNGYRQQAVSTHCNFQKLTTGTSRSTLPPVTTFYR